MTTAERERLVATRRELHRHPELAFAEVRTAGVAAERLRAAGYRVRTGVGRTGVVGEMEGSGDGPTLLLRADMDALPVGEETAHDFVSTAEGAMHACGHDARVAVGLAVAERLAARRDWPGRVRWIFQPAEEISAGARAMIADGVLEGVDAALGLHVWLGLPSGTIGVVAGPQMASSADFELTVRGRGGHGAMPEDPVDAVLVASQVVIALQSIVSRTVSPLDAAVITVAAFHAGEAHNVIAETAAAEAVVGAGQVRSGPGVRTMAAEDFGEVLQRVPGCFFFVGGRNEVIGAVHPHHSPRFDLCEEALPIAVEVLEAAARRVLGAGDARGA